ncbi:hypothetical protein QBC47DRAFT_411225 [Echria macrotheca]|uniref:2-dehydropantoate 2-reductase n=1 Tax=Echria macrotheca TaxID=438768 RepID=A0AAJ0BHX4_9PEZI|nr:hypothetical protein QBC47DRAFT_411225 [Echria macrotheca]
MAIEITACRFLGALGPGTWHQRDLCRHRWKLEWGDYSRAGTKPSVREPAPAGSHQSRDAPDSRPSPARRKAAPLEDWELGDDLLQPEEYKNLGLGLDGGLSKDKITTALTSASRTAEKARSATPLNGTRTSKGISTDKASSPLSRSAPNEAQAPGGQIEIPELDRTAAKLRLLDEETEVERRHVAHHLQPWKPSDQVYVLGLGLAGRYVAHALAGSESIPPVRYLMTEPFICREWESNGHRFTLELRNGKETITHKRVIGEYAPRPDNNYRPWKWPVSDTIIENLIVTVSAGHVLKALEPIIHRLDHRSTICLIQDGLGIAEAIVDAYFPNTTTRPVFILGHMATSLGQPSRDDLFTVAEVNRRKLYLTLFTPHARGAQLQTLIKRHPPTERVLRQTHLVKLLLAMPGLYGHAHPMEDWLRRKLFTVGFRAIADPLVTLFDCTYDKIADNIYAKQLMDTCLNELCNVIMRFPECRNMQKFRKFQLASTLREEFIRTLRRRRTADSAMRAFTARGWDTDVDFLTGYFVRRGRELGVPVGALESLMLAVKAKQVIFQQRRTEVIPFEEAYSKMTDQGAVEEGEDAGS